MIEPVIRELAQGKNFATISFHLADDAIGTNVMWVDADDEHVLINTEVHRAKFTAVARDPHVTVMIWKADNPYAFAEVRGEVVETVRGPEARAHIDALSHKYTGAAYAGEIQSERVILRIAPNRQLARGL